MAIDNVCEKLFCTGCSTCMQICPHKAITMETDSEGFCYPLIHENCIECGLCGLKCPVNSELPKYPGTFYMGWHQNRNVLKSSSSGGVFTALAKYTIDRGGVVFGAIKNQKNEIVHTSVQSMDELEPLKLSKYYQSSLGDSYTKARNFLLDGRLVLFTGTACQVAGLISFLGKSYPNLITMDVLCHGVTSKKTVDAFLASKEKQFKKKITDYHFRVKEETRGWYNGGGSRMHLFFADGTEIVEPGRYDTFFLGFTNNFFLRESCYHCRFCGTERVSDLTLADYWKCEHPEITDEQKKWGVALVLANTETGKKILSESAEDVTLYEIDGTEAIAHNLALVKPPERPELRDTFFERIKTTDYDKIIHDQFKERFIKRRIKRVLKSLLPRLLYERCFNDG